MPEANDGRKHVEGPEGASGDGFVFVAAIRHEELVMSTFVGRGMVVCALQLAMTQGLLTMAQAQNTGYPQQPPLYRVAQNYGQGYGSGQQPYRPAAAAAKPATYGASGATVPRAAASRPAAPRTTASATPAAPARTAAAPARTAATPAALPTVAQALGLAPVQPDVDYTKPTAEEAAKCKISARKFSGRIGWVVEDASGAILRKFVDTVGDNRVHQWSYYRDGVEVYRDIDSNSDGTADQYRWLGTAGTRWGVDKEGNGTIKSWIVISPEEVTAEVIAALATQDTARFARLALTPAEAQALGLGTAKTKQLLEKITDLTAKFKDLAAAKKLTPKSKWTQFSGSQPGVIPAGTDGSANDVVVYENAAAIIQNGSEHSQVLIGTLVKVGDAWRVIDIPKILPEGQNEMAAGFFFQTSPAARVQTAAPAPPEPAQETLAEIETMDKAAGQAVTPEEQAQFNAKRAALLEKLIGQTTKPDERAMWIKQLADMIGAAVQAGTFADGDKRLQALFDKLQGREEDRQLAGYVKFRQLTAEYGLSVQAKGADFAKVQTEWLKKLEGYVADYPKSSDSAEAMLQLGIAQEFAGQEAQAKKWYQRITSDFVDSAPARKAAGSITRLDSVGRVLSFHGKTSTGQTVDLEQYRGRAVLIHFWATWCQPCKADMVTLKELNERYGRSGLTIIGVNLDNAAPTMTEFLRDTNLPWPQIFEPGGLDSRPAVDLGILTLPAMLLVDREGKVTNRAITAAEVEAELKKLLK
jgi:thiol-disulfide isomerase/thioredoxin